MNKKIFKEELKKYLYSNCHSYSTFEIDKSIEERTNWIDGYFNLVDDGEYKSIEDAFAQAKEDFRLVFSKLNLFEFTNEVVEKLYNEKKY